jgi:glycine oxidase
MPPPSAKPSLAIVGAGIIGMSAAWRLAQHGFRVTVFERGSIGSEASWAGAGMLAPGGEVESASEFANSCLASRQLYRTFVRDLEKTSGILIDYQECGGLDVAYSTESASMLEARAAQQAMLGIDSKPVSLNHITSFWPRLNTEGLLAARFYPGDAIVDPRQIIAALKVACRNLGVEIFEQRPVFRVDVSSDTVVLQAGGSTTTFDLAVIAAGAWSSSILLHGLPPLPPAEPVKGHLIAYRLPPHTCTAIVRHGNIYVLQRANGLLIVGASVEHVGFDRSIDPQIVLRLAEQAGFLFPDLRETSPSDAWIGFRPASEAVHVKPWHSNRLYLAYGHYRNGILLAPLTAARLVDEISANWGIRWDVHAISR